MRVSWKTIPAAAAAALLLFSQAAPMRAASPPAQEQPAPEKDDADPGSPPPPVSDPTLARILEQWDKRQQETQTLVATFTERKELNLLAKPVISKGEFFYSRPN